MIQFLGDVRRLMTFAEERLRPKSPYKNEDTKVGDNGGFPKMTVDCRNPMRLLFEHDPKFFVAQIPPSAHQMVLAAVAATPRSSCSSRRLWM
jgi:hypothetical protein